MNYGFIIDNRKCIGCHACTVACKAEHDTPIGVNRTWVKYIEKGEFPATRRHFSVMRCNHCANAPCVEICPVTALYHRPDGIVDFDKNRCIGCKACTQACPYDALYIDPQSHTAAKCNYCAHRIDLDLEPACVNVCPETAIVSGDMDDPSSKISQLLAREQVSVRKGEKGTDPKLFYIDGDCASLDAAATSQSADYMWNSQSKGVGHYSDFIGRRSRKDPTEMLVQLSVGTSQQGSGPEVQGSVGRPLEKGSETKFFRKALFSLSKGAHRVYDAPSKGVLWNWEVSAYIWTKAIATGAFILPFSAKSVFGLPVPETTQWLAVTVAVVFLAVTGVLLIKDLDRPDRFLYVLFRPQWKSWLVRGAYLITLFGLLLGLWILASIGDFIFIRSVLSWPGIILAVFTALYTAFLFAQAKGRDYWQSPLLAIHMLVHAIMAGAGCFGILAYFLAPSEAWQQIIHASLAGGIIANLLTITIELITPHPTDDAAAVVASIIRGRFCRVFWGGIILFGNCLPLLFLLHGSAEGLALAGISALIGLYLTEHVWVRAPQLIPLS